MEPGESKTPAKPFTLKARVASFRYAFAGGRVMLASQHNAWIHSVATIAVLTLALVVGVTRLEWALLGLAIGLVWAMEALNTALELLADEVAPHFRPGIGRAKDVAAFAVLVAALAAVAVGCLVFVPYLSG